MLNTDRVVLHWDVLSLRIAVEKVNSYHALAGCVKQLVQAR